jgi:hypothetical protein
VSDTLLTTVIGALLAHFDTHLSEVDYTSQTEYFPAIQTGNTALLAMPFGTTTTVRYLNRPSRMVLAHRIPFRFWIKHVQGAPAATMAAAFDLGIKAVRVLQDHDNTDFLLTPGVEIEYVVDANLTEVHDLPWLVATLRVPVQTYNE